MSLRRRHSASVRWGHLHELDGRFRIGSPGYRGYPLRLKHLAAWRACHLQQVSGGSHMPVRMAGTRAGIRPSSNLPLKRKEKFVLDRIK